MNKLSIFFLSFCLCQMVFAQNPFYRYQGQVITLQPDTTAFIIFNSNTIIGGGKTVLSSLIAKSVQDLTPNSLLVEVNPNTSNASVESAKQSLKATNSMLQFSRAYTYQGKRVYPTNQIIISLKPNSSIVQINALFGNKYVSATKNQFSSSYLLTLKNMKDLFSLTESIHQSGLVEWAEPNLISGTLQSNPLYSQQYYLNNTGQNGGIPNIDINAPEAWALANTCGANARIRVAVIDVGVEEHEDLSNLLPIGYDARNPVNPGRPISPELSHGQACAGIIGADDNNIGVRGVATNVEILPIKIFFYGIDAEDTPSTIAYTENEVAESLEWAWRPEFGNADILSNSWVWGIPNNAITTAIQNARNLGRGGKGCAVIFGSGNYSSDVIFPATLEGVITVGAVDKSGNLANYSCTGIEMDLVAPSGRGISSGNIVTIDRMGVAGYDSENYTNGFNGTSATCPQVAGVAALMLQVNPNLTEIQVREILQQTARDLGATGFDNDTGYGLVDAQAALLRVIFGKPKIYSPSFRVCRDISSDIVLLNVSTLASVTWQTSGGTFPTSGTGAIATIRALQDDIATITFAVSTSCGTNYFAETIKLGAGGLEFPSGQGWTGNQNPISIGSVVTYTYPLPLAGSYQSFSCFATPAGQVPPLEDARGTYQFPWQVLGCSVTNGQMSVQVLIGSGIGSVGFNVFTSCGPATFGVLVEVPTPDPNNPPDCSYKFDLAYPNPTNGFLTVERPKPPRPPVCNSYPWLPFQLKLYDAKGILQRETTSEGDNATLNVAELQRGLFVLHIIHNGEIEQKRILLE